MYRQFWTSIRKSINLAENPLLQTPFPSMHSYFYQEVHGSCDAKPKYFYLGQIKEQFSRYIFINIFISFHRINLNTSMRISSISSYYFLPIMELYKYTYPTSSISMEMLRRVTWGNFLGFCYGIFIF